MSGPHGAGGRSWDEVPHIPMVFPDYMAAGVHSGRGTGHQIAMTDTIVPALAATPEIRKLINRSRICYFAGAKHGRSQRNRDLVLGIPGPGAVFDTTVGMLKGIPPVPIASGEYKSVMTELGKNAGNRRDDLRHHASQSRSDHGPATITFGVCPVNAADDYYSYTARAWRAPRPNGVIAAAKAVDTLRGCVQGDSDKRLDILWTPVIDANNHPDSALRTARWVPNHPQPADGDELSWGHFVAQLADQLYRRLS